MESVERWSGMAPWLDGSYNEVRSSWSLRVISNPVALPIRLKPLLPTIRVSSRHWRLGFGSSKADHPAAGSRWELAQVHRDGAMPT